MNPTSRLIFALIIVIVSACNRNNSKTDSDNKKAVGVSNTNKLKVQSIPDTLVFIDNEKLKFTTINRYAEFSFDNYKIIVDLSTKQWLTVKNLTKDAWLKLLNDTTKDWAANLILHNIYEKNARRLLIFNNREKWIFSQKKEDTEYWTKNLSLYYDPTLKRT